MNTFNNKNGNELESRFNTWLNSCKKMYDATAPFAGKYNIVGHVWLSSEKKDAPFDFWVMATPDLNTVIFCDVVGWSEVPAGIRLNTKSKDWNRLLAYCKQHLEELKVMGYPFTEFKAYIVYSPTKGYTEGDWEFMKVSNNLPSGGVLISKDRKKGLRTPESVFGKTQDWVMDEEEHFKDADGKEFVLNAMLRTKEHSKACHELCSKLKTVSVDEYVEENLIDPSDLIIK